MCTGGVQQEGSAHVSRTLMRGGNLVDHSVHSAFSGCNSTHSMSPAHHRLAEQPVSQMTCGGKQDSDRQQQQPLSNKEGRTQDKRDSGSNQEGKPPMAFTDKDNKLAVCQCGKHLDPFSIFPARWKSATHGVHKQKGNKSVVSQHEKNLVPLSGTPTRQRPATHTNHRQRKQIQNESA